jgi:hypothetical protein
MAKSSFANLKVDLDAACVVLRGFTLGHRGTTQRGGAASILKVTELCNRMVDAFVSGPDALRAANLAASGRTRVAAAQYRLDILRAKRSGHPLAKR